MLEMTPSYKSHGLKLIILFENTLCLFVVYESLQIWGQIGIRLGTKHVIYQKLEHNATGALMKLGFEGLEMQK